MINLILFLVITMGIIVFGLWLPRSRSQSIIHKWVIQNDFQLLRCRQKSFDTGLFRWWTISRSQTIYSVTVRTPDGSERSGWIRCGSYWGGIYFSNATEVRWESEWLNHTSRTNHWIDPPPLPQPNPPKRWRKERSKVGSATKYTRGNSRHHFRNRWFDYLMAVLSWGIIVRANRNLAAWPLWQFHLGLVRLSSYRDSRYWFRLVMAKETWQKSRSQLSARYSHEAHESKI